MRHSATGRPRSARALFEDCRRRALRAVGASAPAFVAATLAVSASTVAIGCGDSAQKREARALEGASILSDPAPLEQRLIKPSEIAAVPDSAARRTFLQLWSTLQFGAWDRAERFFEPGLRSTIGPALLAEGLQQYLL